MATTQYQIFIRYLNENVNKCLTNRTEVEWVDAIEWANMQEYYGENKNVYNSIKGKPKSQMTILEEQIYEKCTEYERLKHEINGGTGNVVIGNCFMRGYCGGYHGKGKEVAAAEKACKTNMNSIATNLNKLMADEKSPYNPKYDMLFMYDGFGMLSYPGWNVEAMKKYPKYFPWESPKYDNVAIHVDPENDSTMYITEVYMEKMKRVKLDPWFFHSTHASLKSAINTARTLVNILGIEGVKIGKVVALEQYIEIV